MAQDIVPGELGIGDLRHELGLDPACSPPYIRRYRNERRLRRFERPELPAKTLEKRFVESRPDTPAIAETLRTELAQEERSEGPPLLVGGTIAADHEFPSPYALTLDPGSAAPRGVAAVPVLGDESFNAESARLREDLLRLSGQMIAEHDRRLCSLEERLKALLALAERQVAQVLAAGEQEIEGNESQDRILAL